MRLATTARSDIFSANSFSDNFGSWEGSNLPMQFIQPMQTDTDAQNIKEIKIKLSVNSRLEFDSYLIFQTCTHMFAFFKTIPMRFTICTLFEMQAK